MKITYQGGVVSIQGPGQAHDFKSTTVVIQTNNGEMRIIFDEKMLNDLKNRLNSSDIIGNLKKLKYYVVIE